MSKKALNNVVEKTIIYANETNSTTGKAPKVEPYLIQLSGNETGQNHRISAKTIRIGRDITCDICVDDPHVSRLHAEVVSVGTDIILRDLGSTNGIFVNGNKITEHRLLDGDKVLVGTRLYFRFTYQDSHDQNYQQSLFKAANMDALTQLYNKKYFLDVLPKEMSFSRRGKEHLSLMMIDVDHFKKINDTHGHLGGDAVLKAVGAHLNKQLRLENVACRYGGEEFSVILRNCTTELAHTVAERLRRSLEAERIQFGGKEIQVTISIGIATLFNENFATIEDFIHKADEFLYQAKRSGRNRTITSAHPGQPE